MHHTQKTKMRKTSQTNEDDERTATGDTTTQFKLIPLSSGGSNEVGTSNSCVEDAVLELKVKTEARSIGRERVREALVGMRKQ